MKQANVLELEKKCAQFRCDVLKVLHQVQSGHLGGSFSLCEILTVLYLVEMKVDPQRPDWPERDRLVLSKGHGAPMLYRVLAERGFFPVSEMNTLRQLGSRLQGHPCPARTPGVDFATGPLGIGLSGALGLALAQRLNQFPAFTYAILGDGETNEGAVWEAVMAAVKFKADNLILIIDHNGVQLDGTCEEIMPLGDLYEKLTVFGMDTHCVDGHDLAAITEVLQRCRQRNGRPHAIVARTVKGKGVSFMEGKHIWHGRPIGCEDYERAVRELEGADNGKIHS